MSERGMGPWVIYGNDLDRIVLMAQCAYPGRAIGLELGGRSGLELILTVDGAPTAIVETSDDVCRLRYDAVSDGTHPPVLAAASIGTVKIDLGKAISDAMRRSFGAALDGPSAEEAAEAAQASLVALVHDLTAARRRSESLQDQIAYLRERYWIVPKAAT